MPNFAADKLKAAEWARELLEDGNFVIADGETTSLHLASFVSFAMIDSQGNTLFDELINPERDIEEKALSIHKITPEMVADKPNFRHFKERIKDLTNGKTLVIYNAGFDYQIMTRLLESWEHPDVQCAMLQYSKFCGNWSKYHQSYTYMKLPPLDHWNAHNALTDCLSTLEVIKNMAAFASPQTVDDIPF